MAERPAHASPPAEVLASWEGHRLDDVRGANVGRIEGTVDRTEEPAAEARAVRWLLARMGRFGHHTAVPARDAVEGVGRVWVPYTRDQIRHGPKLEPGVPLDGDAERALLKHYRLIV
jgi:hypothetical protein